MSERTLMRAGLLTGLVTLCWPVVAGAVPSFPDEIPNGTVHDCTNCHIGPPNDVVLNAFGSDFSQSSQLWSAALASMDSDFDGIPNGWELQDPTGGWSSGQPAPGVVSLVTLPGDAASLPPRIALDVDRIEHSELAGENLSSFVTLGNPGGLTLDYEVVVDAAWLSTDPVGGLLAAGLDQVVDVLFQTDGLAPGGLAGTVTVSAAGVFDSPQQVAVDLTVLPEPSAGILGLAALAAFGLLSRRRRCRSDSAARVKVRGGSRHHRS